MKNKKISTSMGITCVLMIAVVMIQFAGSIILTNSVGEQILNVSTLIRIISYVLAMAFFYAVYTKQDINKLAVGLISLWGIINIMPMIENVISAAKSLIYSFEASTAAALLYMIILAIMFAFIVIVSIYFITNKNEEKNTEKKTNVILPYIIVIIIMALTMTIFNMWLKYAGYAGELTTIDLLVNSIMSTFFLVANVLKYIIVVLVTKKSKGGNYALLTYILIWYIVFIGKSLFVFLNVTPEIIGITLFIYLVPLIFYTYILVMGLNISIKEIINPQERS